MRKIVVDVENTITQLSEKARDFTPYNPKNKLVAIGWCVIDNDIAQEVNYVTISHKEVPNIDIGMLDKFKYDLANADMIVCHNAKYDLQWLIQSGFKTDHLKLNDTLIMEYVMARGRADISYKLGDLAQKYGVSEKGEIFDKYPDVPTDELPLDELIEYTKADIQATVELYAKQIERLKRPDYKILYRTINMMHDFCRVLVDIEQNGVAIDIHALDKVGEEFTQEAEMLKHELNKYIKKYMGDIPVNLDSPKQLSEVIYSRRVKPGMEEAWTTTFNLGKNERGKLLPRPKMGNKEYEDKVKRLTDVVLKTEAHQCPDCKGEGLVCKTKKNGQPHKRPYKCKTCDGKKAVYKEINELAGFAMRAKNITFTTINGFSTSKSYLDELIDQAREDGKPEAGEFLQKVRRLSAVTSYLSNFVDGIRIYTQEDGILHPNFMQCVTSTGRLSSQRPNLQNQPREKTFPIRQVFISRWKEGHICETDFSQLEFRAAVHLAKDPKGKEDIENGIDIHTQTKDVITAAGQPMDRQEAKSRTFKPLYGGRSGTEAEQEYYDQFLNTLYTGIGEWHKELQEEALSTKMVTLPTGRQFIFPDVQRAWHGGATKATQIVNFPVQAFATGDITPIAIIRLWNEIKARELKSKIVLTVHDSVLVDVFPGEEGIICKLASSLAEFAEEELKSRYGIEMYVGLACDTKIGSNMMEMAPYKRANAV